MKHLLIALATTFVLSGAAGKDFSPTPTESPTSSRAQLPPTLAETGLYAQSPSGLDFDRDSEFATGAATRALAPGVLEFVPRFPLWTDGLLKRRWILLPTGSAIDASDPDRWEFPVGTKAWKEFALPERPVETRFLHLTEDGWLFATYVWDVAATGATLAPVRGVRGAVEVAPGVRHDIPGRFDCASCHEGQVQRVLGFGSVQLATGLTGDGPDLAELSQRGLLKGLPPELLAPPSTTELSRGELALGYLHGNCSHCHNSEGPLAAVGMDLRQPSLPATLDDVPPAIATTLRQRAKTSARAASAAHRIEPGDPVASQIVQRLSTRDPFAQMPPLGTHLVDREAVELLAAWIQNDLRTDASTPTVHAASAPASR